MGCATKGCSTSLGTLGNRLGTAWDCFDLIGDWAIGDGLKTSQSPYGFTRDAPRCLQRGAPFNSMIDSLR